MRISLKRKRHQGECTPRGYRVAYIDYWRGEEACFPFGVHWLVQFFRWAHSLTFRYSEPAWDFKLQQAWAEGYKKGNAQGFEDGLRFGKELKP